MYLGEGLSRAVRCEILYIRKEIKLIYNLNLHMPNIKKRIVLVVFEYDPCTGVYGIRTRDLNNANVARSQLR